MAGWDTVWFAWSGAILLLLTLLALAVIDARTQRLPNILTRPLIALGLFYHWITALDFYPYLLGAMLGYALFWGVETLFRRLRGREGLGRGDAKLLAAGGAWCGAMALPFIILIASAAALVVAMTKPAHARAEMRLAFGPYLAAAIGVIFIAQKFL